MEDSFEEHIPELGVEKISQQVRLTELNIHDPFVLRNILQTQ